MIRGVLLLLCFATASISSYGSNEKLDISDEAIIEPVEGDDTSRKACGCKYKKSQKEIDMENEYARKAGSALSDAFLAHSKEHKDEFKATESIFSKIYPKE